MNNNQTINSMRQMRLSAMADLHTQHLKNNSCNSETPDDYLSILIQHEWEQRQNQKITRLIKQANFKQKASIEDIQYLSSRNLDKNMFTRLSTLDFISRKENVIITGAAGVGKSYIAQALGYQSCINGLKVLYYNTTRLLNRFYLSNADGTYAKELKKLQKVDLLILDDFGLQALSPQDRDILMDIVEDRHNETSTIISSQIPVSVWYDLIGESTIADAILDRIVNSSHRIDLKGESMRKGILMNEK